MARDVITHLLPSLRASRVAGFNVFDVMHHGTHEKQLSNVFRWLLDTDGSHQLGSAFQRIFLDAVNEHRSSADRFGPGPYVVHQEVNTAEPGEGGDIADLVLTSDNAIVVVENYVTSDGHGHSYGGYLSHAGRQGREQFGVVLLCREHDSSAQTDGWENAAVVTYGALVDRLHAVASLDLEYQRRHPDVFWFIQQLHSKFTGRQVRMEDHQALRFIETMCATGEAGRYAEKSAELAGKQFAQDVADQALRRFAESREVLQQIKAKLKAYGDNVLRPQLNQTFGEGFVSAVGTPFQGRYQWTISMTTAETDAGTGEGPLQLKFGPSAWYAYEHDPSWKSPTQRPPADYSRLFITRAKTREVVQSSVTMEEAHEVLSSDDRRLHDEIVALLGPPA